MKITLDPTQFVFTPTLNKISFANMGGAFKPERLLAVTNVTTGKLIYAVASQPNGYNGSFSTTTYTNDTLTYVSSNAGQAASDIIEVLYDSETQPQVVSGTTSSYILDSVSGNSMGGVADPSGGGYKLKTSSSTLAADGTPILSTVDPMTGGDGLNIHLQSSSYGGTLGNPIPIPNNNNAISVAFLNGSTLQTPKMDPVTNELIVQSAGVPLQDVNITNVNGTTLSGPYVPVDIANQSGLNLETNINIGGIAPATGSGANTAQTLRTSANIALNGTNVSANLGANDAGTIRTASNIAFNGTAARTGSGVTDSATQRVVLATDQPTVSTSTNLTTINGTGITLGSKPSSLSLPVVISSDQSNINTSAPDVYITGAATNLLGNNLILASVGSTSYDAAGFKSGSVQVVTAATSGNFTFEGSNDNTNFQVIPVFRNDSASPNAIVAAITPVSSQFIYHFPIKFRYLRLRISSALNNTCQVFTRLSQETWTPTVSNIVNATAANLNATISGSLTSAGTVTQATPANLNCTAVVSGATLAATTTTDIASAAITTTTTSANIATTNLQSVSFLINVTAVSGTSPTLDVVLQETLDGTSYYDVYHFERITAAGQYYSPVMKLSGIGFRFVRTVSGTTPSFTMSAVRISRAGDSSLVRRLIDRTMNPNTTGSSSASIFIEGTNQPFLVVSTGAGGAGGSPIFGIQGSEDGTNWYTIGGSTVTVGTNSIGHANPLQGHLPKFIRATVTSGGGSGYTLNYAMIKSMGN